MRAAAFWGIQAGRTGDADSLFLHRGVVAIGWEKMGDLSKLPPDREAFKAAATKAYPDYKQGAVSTFSSQLYRFVHQIQLGDFVLYPSKHDRRIHIGCVDGQYIYDSTVSPRYPNQRPSKWLEALPRDHFSQGALYEISGSLVQVRNYADEFRAAVDGKQATIHANCSGRDSGRISLSQLL